MLRVLVTVPFTPEQKARLEQNLPEGAFTYVARNGATDDLIAHSDIILGNVPAPKVALATHLRWLQLNSSGADAYAKPGILPAGALLTNSTGAYGLAISEHLLATTLFLKKKLGLYHRNQQKALWQDEGRVTAIQGSTTLWWVWAASVETTPGRWLLWVARSMASAGTNPPAPTI